jgi:hypothetical protein
MDVNKLFGYVAKAIPLVVSAMTAVAQIKGASGSVTKDAGKATIRANIPQILGALEIVAGDVADDKAVIESYDALIEAIYSFDRAVKSAEAVARLVKKVPVAEVK